MESIPIMIFFVLWGLVLLLISGTSLKPASRADLRTSTINRITESDLIDKFNEFRCIGEFLSYLEERMINCDSLDFDIYFNAYMDLQSIDDTDYDDIMDDINSSIIAESPVYNKMISLNGKARRRLINVLVNKHGDLVEAVSIKTFKNLNYGQMPKCIIPESNLGNNINAGKVPVHTAIDAIYSELGYQTAQGLLDDIVKVKELMEIIRK